jgi:DNA-directed DNA polymerase III PolC
MFIHLTTHSAYSLQEGLPTPEEIVDAARQRGMPAVGLTDRRLLTGAVEFVTAAQTSDVQPLLGLEIDLAGGPLTLLAASLEGWSNLCRLSSALALREHVELPCDLETLERCSGGLIALGGGQGLEALRDIFSDRLYLALREPSTAAQACERARGLGLPVVAAPPVYYLEAEQAALQRTLSAIRLNQPLGRLPAGASAPPGSYFADAQEVERRFEEFPEALAATTEIASRCRYHLPLGVPRMPALPLPAGMTAPQLLRQKAEQGARELYGAISPAVQTRLDHELEVIAHMGFEPVFLIVEEILDFARRNGIPFSSRGSAASSLVAHCLHITSPDPMRLDLYFERFLNPARLTPPDIDTDLCSRRRDAVIRHVFEVYGEERVAMVGTINRFRPRSALGEVAKAHGLEASKVRALVNQLPDWYWSRGEEQGGPRSPFAGLRGAHPAYAEVFDQAEALLELPRHLSVHAGGLIVAPGPLTDLLPVMRSGSKGVIITQFDLDSVEALGLVKIDLLGIRGLTVVGDVAEAVARQDARRQAGLHAVLEAIPSEDLETSRRVESGGTIGCFQIESPGMRATLREIHARSEDDIMAALALYRPGPLSGGLKEAFVRRFKGEEAVVHLHAALAPLLEDTFGVILYQEQVLRIAHELAGFSLAEADLLRRAMSHFDPGKRMQELERKFVGKAEAKSGLPPAVGKRVWEMMAAFAGYGFPKAHAASYAQVAWRSAWCKTHFPAEFMAAVLANWGGYYSQRVYLSEARRMGLAVRPPQVNFPALEFSVHRSAGGEAAVLFMGLGQVRDLTQRTIGRIVQHAPFRSLEDFLARADPRPAEAENLARVGALEEFGTIPAILQRLRGGSWRRGQMSLFDWGGSSAEDWTLQQKVAAQEEVLGTGIDAHPLELAAGEIEARGAITTVEAAARLGRRVTVAGVRQTSRRSRTSKGEPMMFLSLEDLTGLLDVVIFPDVYRYARRPVESSAPLLITGVVETDAVRAEPFLRAEKVERVG